MALVYLLTVFVGLNVLLWVLPFVIGPFIVRNGRGVSANPEYRPLDLDDVRPDQRRHILMNAPALASLGFTAAAHATKTNGPKNSITIISVWINRATGDAAAVTSIHIFRRGRVVNATDYVEFETGYQDRTSVNTSNVSLPGQRPPMPNLNRLRVPGLADITVLWQIHRNRIAQLVPAGGRPVLPDPGQELAVLCGEHSRALLRHVAEAGYFRLERDGQRYRYTFKGAALSAWLLAWPVGPVRKALLIRRARQTLRLHGYSDAAFRLPGVPWREWLPPNLRRRRVVEQRTRGFAPVLKPGEEPSRTPPQPVTRSGPST